MDANRRQRLLSDPRLYRFVDSQHRPVLVGPDLRVVATVKMGDSDRRRILHVTDGKRDMAMKIVLPLRFRDKLATMFGPYGLRHEMSMIRLAASAGLLVPCPVADGSVRRLGIPVAQAMLTEWIADSVPLRNVVLGAIADGREDRLTRAATAYVQMISRIREAGFGDADCGVGQLLVSSDSAKSFDPIWVDLEAWFVAEPCDDDGTCRTLAAALVNWWIAVHGDQSLFNMFVELVRGHLPQPSCGWSRLGGPVNCLINRRMPKQIRKGRIDRFPDPVEFG